jgi:ribose 5-phosphate isomerase A
MSSQQKEQAAVQAIDYIKEDVTIGVGTGSTVNIFIDALQHVKNRIKAAVASSIETEKRLKALGIPVIDLNVADEVAVYIDGADEVTHHKQMIKGGGGALTREKIIASASKQFVCIVDESKVVKKLGAFPLAIEVIPMARSYVARELVILGGSPEYREGYLTDNGNIILDLYHCNLNEPLMMEEKLNNITGVVCHGLFAKCAADVVLVGNDKLSD